MKRPTMKTMMWLAIALTMKACSATNIAKEIDADILRASGVGP
ncbi:MAG: hypothetical protein ACI4RA_10190 [Kiritimatiellia bacterium]